MSGSDFVGNGEQLFHFPPTTEFNFRNPIQDGAGMFMAGAQSVVRSVNLRASSREHMTYELS